MVHGDLQQLNHKGISDNFTDSTSWKYDVGHFDPEVFVNYKIQEYVVFKHLVFCGEKQIIMHCIFNSCYVFSAQ